MPDRRASFERLHERSRPRSPASEGFVDHPESVTTSATTRPTTHVPRRRPLRTNSTPNNEYPQSASPTWVDADKRESKKTKGGRLTPRKASRGNSPHSATPPKLSVLELKEREKDTVRFLPKLSRILEGRESKTSRRRRSSTASSADEYIPARRRRRTVEDATLARRPIRHKHGSLQRRVESLANLPNPSLISVLSGVTQQSSTSSGSNSTITQKSYDRTHISKHRPTKERKRLQVKSTPTRAKTMASQQSTVFQYMNEGLDSEHFLNSEYEGGRPSSSSSSSSYASSHDTRHEDVLSSNAEEPLVESPMTSPASTRRPDLESHYRHRVNSDSGTSVRGSSPESTQLASVNHHVEEDEDEDEDEGEEEDEDEEEEEEEEESDDEDGDDNADSADDHNNSGHAHHVALERAAPPRLPSASSSRHSDPYTRRLRKQEQELRNHVLQSPQPHRGFQFVGGPSPNPQPAMPLYDAYSHTGASPVNSYASAPQAPIWPPPAPPPPRIGYYSPPHVPPTPYSQGTENSFAMASQNAMAAPNTAVQPPPFYHAPQPLRYQPQPTGPDLSKTTVVGYELLAHKLTEVPKDDNEALGEGKVVPMYRKFEQLNHRVLLHLQDEISELEEELRQLDECIAQSSPGSEVGHRHPASRRGEARYGSELHYRRTDLLGRIYLKLGQYNQALSSFSTMSKNLDPANAEDIQAYRTWVERHAPIDHAEARFLERKNDLLAVSRRRSASTVGGVGLHQSAAIGLPLILVLPLMAFAIVPGLLGRLFIVVLIGAAEVTVVTSTELVDFMTVKEWVTCASVYFGFMAVLAGVVH